jgi:hypothetical protein
MNLKGGFHGLIVLSWHLLGETEGNHEKPRLGWLVTMARFKPSTS